MDPSNSLTDRAPNNDTKTPEQIIDASNHDASTTPTDLASLQRELAELRSKVAALEREADLDVLEEEDDDGELPEFMHQENMEEGFEVQWDEWLARRKVARAIIRKVERMKQQREKKLESNTKRSTHDEPPIPPPSKPTRHPSTLEPTLNLVTWSEFKKPKGAAPSSFVIDVLIGASDPAWNRGGRFYMSKSEPNKAHSMLSDVPTLTAMTSGKFALPERIRINSSLLLSILRDVEGGWGFGHVESIVLLRPYKTLLYHHEVLQSKYKTLMEQHGSAGAPCLKAAPTLIASSSLREDAVLMDKAPGSDTNSSTNPARVGDETAANNAAETVNSKLALMHLNVLMEFVNNTLLVRQRYIESEHCLEVAFSDLWLLFKPGDIVFGTNRTQAYRIYEVLTPVHEAKSPWDSKTPLDSAFLPHPLPGDGAPAPYNSGSYIGDDLPFRVWCVYIDSDGSSLGPVTIAIDIPPFVGEKSIGELPLIPVRVRTPTLEKALAKYGYTSDSSWSALRESLVTRGREFVKMNKIQHAYYKGPAYNTRARVEGQVVVDMTHAYESGRKGTQSPPLQPPMFYNWARGSGSRPPIFQGTVHCTSGCCLGDVVSRDQGLDEYRNMDFRDSLVPMDPSHAPSIAAAERLIAEVISAHATGLLTDDEYLIMSERVLGFILQSRKWIELNLGHMSSVTYNKTEAASSIFDSTRPERTAFDELVLPDGHKDVIVSLVAQHFRDEESSEVDIFKGKGKGLILLLHGAPGVGKTSTAEGVAEAFKKPLLQITCGDLGSTARDVEEALERNFELASRWDCVLLLDEADVFLASRSRADSGSDLNRNALVAVFLRVLEYYTGILFLTTNRIGDFDEAFASRVHVSLEYPQLTEASTTSILQLNIRMIKKRFEESNRKIEIDEVDISRVFLNYWHVNAKARLNGRQIRNACQTALALAEFKAQGGSHEAILDANATVHLEATHFDTILRAYLAFNKYLKDIYGVTQDERATEKGYRAPQGAAGNMAETMQHRAPQPSGFPGTHLYQHKPHVSPAQQVATSGQHVFPPQPQVQHGYYMPTQQQGYILPSQNANSVLPFYQQPPARSEVQALPGEQGIGQGAGDTSAGHDPQVQMSPYAFAPGAQYLQPQATGPRS